MTEERKLFDEAGITVTTHRLVIGSEVCDIALIKHASEHVDRPWACVFLLAVPPFLLLFMMLSANIPELLVPALIGIPLGVGAAYLTWSKMTDSELWLWIGDDFEKIKIKDLDRLNRVTRAINQAIELQRSASYRSLRTELDGLSEL